MTAAAIPALEQEVRFATELIATLTPAEWERASACEGWRVQDVVQHMASVFQQIADPTSIDMGDSGKAETSAEVPVQARRDWTIDQVFEAYEEWSPKGVAALTGLQEPPMADVEVPLSDLGTHPLNLLGNAIVFDHYCHLRFDIGAAVDRAAALPRDDGALDGDAGVDARRAAADVRGGAGIGASSRRSTSCSTVPVVAASCWRPAPMVGR